MKILEVPEAAPRTLLSERLNSISGTGGVTRDLLSGIDNQDSTCWSGIIEDLKEWGADPDEFEDEGIVPPNLIAIGQAIALAEYLQSNHVPPPTGVYPIGDGGVAFEKRDEDALSSVQFTPDGHIRIQSFIGGKLKHDEWVPLG